MIDAHCHLNFSAFEKDFDEVIKNAQKEGVHTIINAGTQISSSKWAVELAGKFPNLYAVIAVHPHHADKLDSNDNTKWSEELEALGKHPKVVGIGEFGLDYYNYKSNGIVDPELQKKVFLTQLEIAHALKLPLQIHTRDDRARTELVKLLKNNKSLLLDPPGMFHCFAGSMESMNSVLDLGFYLGFDGNITYGGTPPGEPLPLADLVKSAPLERIMIETDSPYLTPMPLRGRRNEPKYAIITGKFISKIKNISFEEVEHQTEQNVYTVFKKISRSI